MRNTDTRGRFSCVTRERSAASGKKMGRFWLTVLLLTFFLCFLDMPFSFEDREVARLLSDDPQGIRRVVAAASYESGKSVVFIGDSCVYSSVAREDKKTVPSYFATYLNRPFKRGVSVYDVSLPGLSFPGIYEVAKYVLAAKPDLVIIDINPAWFGNTKAPEHMVLADLNNGRETPPSEVRPVGRFPDDLYQPWYNKDFSQLTGQPKLGAYRTDGDNLQWTAFCRLAELVRAADTRVVFFLPPRNRELYQKYGLLDDRLYKERVAQIKEKLPPGSVLLDYSWAVESSLFSDLTHMFPDGNKKLGRMLSRAVLARNLL